ncbi:AAA family ATPase [Sulfurovum sp. bin170]|uniref:AAA family ATPase n=1 Tax=Sulfurovum sp. bin170 TaxID=2695268 RepID=UPI0013DF3F02|nr:ATP-binding protein [Sulfurovum sp. bin170]NEW60150.1 AAA family ATPase [Sulfurovum sp. bin170]
MFVAREEELSELSSLLTKKSSSFTVVYGRRRVGKTETVRHFIKENNLLSLEVTGVYGATKATQINAFVRKIERASRGEIVAVGRLKEWQDVFFLLEDYISSLGSEKKVIFLDELPWLDTHRSGFLSAFSEFWNDFCTRKSDIILIVCGSATSYMINRIVKNRKTLHNRVTQKLNMQPFKLRATKKLLEAKNCRYSNKSIVDTYIVLGGVAKYINDMDCTKHQLENISFQCFSRNGLLVTEYQELYESLFQNSQWHYKVMNLLSSKWSGYIQKDIAQALNTSASVVKKVLEELELSGFITSVTQFGKTTREKVYRATDSFSYFYNKWMEKHQNIEWRNVALSQQYKIWSGFAFENICHIHTDEIKEVLGVSGVNTQTHYWSHKGEKGTQIDMLLEYTDGSKNIDIIECKYHDDKFSISKKYYYELRDKISVFNEQTKSRYNIRLIFVTMFGVVRNEYYNELVYRDVLIGEVM